MPGAAIEAGPNGPPRTEDLRTSTMSATAAQPRITLRQRLADESSLDIVGPFSEFGARHPHNANTARNGATRPDSLVRNAAAKIAAAMVAVRNDATSSR